MNLAKKIALISFALVAAAVFAAIFLSEHLLTAVLTEQIAARSGLHTQLSSAHFDFWPSLRIKALGLELSNPDALAQTPILSADELSVRLPYADLFAGRPRVTDIVLKRPVLRVAEAMHAPKVKVAPDSGRDVIVSGPFTVVDGVIVDENLRRHAAARIEAIQLRAEETREGALAVSLDGRMSDMNFHADAKADSAADLWAGRPARVDVAATADPHSATTLNVRATLRATRNQLGFDDVTGTWRNGKLNASGNVSFGGQAPILRADLHLDRLDLGSLDTAQVRSSVSEPAARDLTPLSDTAVDMKPLRLVDAIIDLKAGELRAAGLRVTNVGLRTTLDDGILRVGLKPADFYQGKVSGNVLVDASLDTPTQSVKFSFADVQAGPLLTDLNGFRQFDGTLQMSADLESHGASPKAIVGNLSGSADIAVKDGVVTGQKLPDLFRGVSAYLPQAWRDLNDKITINSVTAKFAVANGTASTDDLHVFSPVADIDGKGNIDLVARTFDLRFDPKIVTTANNPAKSASALDLGAAILVRGPWNDPQISADLSGLMRDPQKTLGKLQGLGEQFLGNSDKSPPVGSDEIMKGINNLMKGFTSDNPLGGR
ncbi:MAG: AsmA-like C-terminal region-containing protein [Beijerinckiaceae bacterium]